MVDMFESKGLTAAKGFVGSVHMNLHCPAMGRDRGRGGLNTITLLDSGQAISERKSFYKPLPMYAANANKHRAVATGTP